MPIGYTANSPHQSSLTRLTLRPPHVNLGSSHRNVSTGAAAAGTRPLSPFALYEVVIAVLLLPIESFFNELRKSGLIIDVEGGCSSAIHCLDSSCFAAPLAGFTAARGS